MSTKEVAVSRDVIAVMNRDGHATHEYDPNDPESIAAVKEKIDKLLRKGYWLLGKRKDDGKLEIITREQINDDRYSSLLLSKDYRKLVMPAPQGG